MPCSECEPLIADVFELETAVVGAEARLRACREQLHQLRVRLGVEPGADETDTFQTRE
jgi:hypothetical protein